MNYSKAKDQTLIIVLAISTLLYGLDHQQILNFPKDIVLRIMSPAQIPFFFARSNLLELATTARSIPSQQRHIKDLDRRLAELSLKANKSEELEKEIATIKANTKINDDNGYTPVTAKVISLTRFALINKGESDGVKIGQAVVTNDSIVGTVKSVLAHRSLVRLLKDPETNLDIITLNGTVGRLKYQDNNLSAEEILQKNQLAVEEPVYTKGSADIPDGLLIGYINKIKENPTSVYKEAYIDPALEITDQSYIVVATH